MGAWDPVDSRLGAGGRRESSHRPQREQQPAGQKLNPEEMKSEGDGYPQLPAPPEPRQQRLRGPGSRSGFHWTLGIKGKKWPALGSFPGC